jgi:UDP:flavonoid glycosyltransferase YjiC (YdhE family)
MSATTVFLSTLGSFGDVHPYLSLGRALRDLGADPVFFVNPADAEAFADAGLEAHGVGDRIDVDELLHREPKYLHPTQGTRFAMEDLFAPFSAQVYGKAMELAPSRPPALCVSHHMCLGTAWVAEKLGLPSVMAHLAPASLLSRTDPPALGGRPTPSWLRRLVLRMALPLFSRLSNNLYGAAAQKVGLVLEPRSVMETILRPNLTLCLWPTVFRGAAADDPPETRIVGFPPTGGAERSTPTEVEAFLEAGEPPILFGQGSSAVHAAGDFFDHAVAVCRALGRRGLLVTGQGGHASNSSGLFYTGFVPFDAVLPRCAAFVHHGSVGSTAAGLTSGVPTVAVPVAHDQFDNAARAEALGVSATVVRTRLSPARLLAALGRVLGDDVRARAGQVSERVLAEGNGACNGARELLALI